MKILVDVKDSKADFLMELLSNISFVKKAEPVKKEKLSSLKDDLRAAFREVKLAEEGKIKLQSARDFLNEL